MEYANYTREMLRAMGVEFVDIDDISSDGLLHDEEDRVKIAQKFKAAGVDGLFFPHTNFGTEYEVARLAKEMGLPVLLWGPRDERPDAERRAPARQPVRALCNGARCCAASAFPSPIFATAIWRDEAFERGVKLFLAVCNTVKAFRKTRILQIGPRPFDFWSTMCNEGELLEKFNIQLAPVPLAELTAEMKKAKAEGKHVRETIEYCRKNFKASVSDEQLENVAALKGAMRSLAEKYGCNAGCIQCWNALAG